MRLVSLCFVLISLSIQSFSQDSIDVSSVTKRPGFTQASRAVYKNGFLIEAGFQYSKDRYLPNGSDRGYTTLLIPNLGLVYGVSKNIEVRVFGNLEAYKFNYSGNSSSIKYKFNGLLIGTKINLTEAKNLLPEMALLITQGIPTNSELYNTWTTSAVLAWSYSLPANFGLSGNLGATYESDFYDGELHGNSVYFNYTLHIGYSIKENLGTYLEVYGGGTSYGFETNVSGGLYYRFSPKFQVDALCGYGSGSGTFLVNTGCSWLLMK